MTKKLKALEKASEQYSDRLNEKDSESKLVGEILDRMGKDLEQQGHSIEKKAEAISLSLKGLEKETNKQLEDLAGEIVSLDEKRRDNFLKSKDLTNTIYTKINDRIDEMHSLTTTQMQEMKTHIDDYVSERPLINDIMFKFKNEMDDIKRDTKETLQRIETEQSGIRIELNKEKEKGKDSHRPGLNNLITVEDKHNNFSDSGAFRQIQSEVNNLKKEVAVLKNERKGVKDIVETVKKQERVPDKIEKLEGIAAKHREEIRTAKNEHEVIHQILYEITNNIDELKEDMTKVKTKVKKDTVNVTNSKVKDSKLKTVDNTSNTNNNRPNKTGLRKNSRESIEFTDTNNKAYEVRSSRNRVDMVEKSGSKEKFESNQRYIESNPFEYNSIKKELPPKYIDKNIILNKAKNEGCLEIEHSDEVNPEDIEL
mmetsp:Transcript_25431/g.26495  ORF Transcript_25431/g.26495 Transcript_25431/m.26495 type:complete len:425 (-) Transcript_25431:6-1280(-)